MHQNAFIIGCESCADEMNKPALHRSVSESCNGNVMGLGPLHRLDKMI